MLLNQKKWWWFVRLPLTALSFIVIFTIFFISCKKSLEGKEDFKIEQSVQPSPSVQSECDLNVTVCEDCAFQEQIEESESTDQYATILGDQYVNPYSISVMTQSYNAIHSTNIQALPASHLYVRFKPQTEADLIVLDSLDLELYDYPLDRTVIQDGEYWPDAYVGLGQNEFPWLYTVVESGFQFPAGIIYESLQPLYIPDDDGPVEDYAFNMTGNTECSGGGESIAASRDVQPNKDAKNSSSKKKDIQPMVPMCPDDYHWDYALRECVPNDCPPGYYWNGSECVLNTPPPPTNLYPRGMITFKTYDDYGVVPPSAPVKYTRVVGKRFFKIDKTYTDASGNFSFSKRFPRKVTVVVKFKLSSGYGKHTVLHTAAGLGLWKEKFPIRKNIGTYKGADLRNLNYEFKKGSNSRKWATRRWLACVALNAVLETNSFLNSNNMEVLDNKVKIFLAHPNDQTEQNDYNFIYNSAIQRSHEELLLTWLTSNLNSLSTSKVTVNVAQQLGILYLNKLDGPDINWYRYKRSFAQGPDPWPFGNGIAQLEYYPELIAVWQSFAQHIGHTVADRFFSTGQSEFVLQGKTWTSSTTLSSSSKYLEEFDPNITPPNELFPWIPVGLITDLIDNNPDPSSVVIDNVSGFTYLEIETALKTKPGNMSDFKTALKTIKPVQSTEIDQLFIDYGY